jgi:hypothetical protein
MTIRTPRPRSTVMSAADTKAKIAEIKGLIKAAKADVKTNADLQKALDKQYATGCKEIAKTKGNADKALAKLEADLAKLTPA